MTNIDVSRTDDVQLDQKPCAPQFYRHLHIFRALTIMIIVWTHTSIMPILKYTDDYSVDPQLKWLNSICQTLFHDSTLLFTFISGLLFSLVLSTKGWAAFYGSKIKNVLLPYIVITFLYTLLGWLYFSIGSYKISPDNLYGYVRTSLSNIPSGLAGFHLWYIPVLLSLFAITPLLNIIVKTEKRLLIIVIVLAPLVVSRVWPHFSWKTVVYFMGAYILGMYFAIDYRKNINYLSSKLKLVLLLTCFLSVTSVCLYQYNLGKWSFVNIRDSILYVQKIGMAFLLLQISFHFENRFPAWLDVIGRYSFPIYFIHTGILMVLLKLMKDSNLLSNNPLYVVVLGVILFFVVIGFTLILSVLVKRIFGKHSRMLVGA